MGRGVYFKYVSNLSILLIIAIGAFIYSGTVDDSEETSFFSKFVTNTQASEGVLKSSGTETILSRKANIVKYKVQDKDTLSAIANKFSTDNNKISIDTIKWANNLSDDNLVPGSILEFPPVSGTLHTVQANESLIDIAAKYGRTKDKSEVEVNGVLQQIADINLLEIQAQGEKKVPVVVEGQKIIIPGGVVETQIPTVASTAPLVSDPIPNNPVQVPDPQPISTDPVITNPVQGGSIFGWPVAGGGGIVTQYASPYHMAWDIADGSSPYLVSVGKGVVKSAGWEDGGGAWMVRILYDGGYEAAYAHLADNSFLVGPGDVVEPGQAIGVMGMSGLATGIHVHFELYLNGIKQDPYGYISR